MSKIARRERKDNHNYLFMMGAVAVVAVVALVLNSMSAGLEGAVPTYKEVLPNEEYQAFCTDEEPDNNYYVEGTVTFKNKKFHDYCYDDLLFQFQCDTSNTVDATRPYECQNGCKNGACLR